MQDKIKEFNILVDKKAKISKENTDKAVKILFNIFQTEKNVDFLIEKLIFASHVVTSEYARRYVPEMSKHEIREINLELVKNLNKHKVQMQSLLPVTFSFAAMGFLRSCHKQEFLPLLKSTIIKCEDKNTFNETKCKIFRDHLLDKCNANFLELDFSEWEEYDRKRLSNFLIATFSTTTELNKVSYSKLISSWKERYNFIVVDETDTQEPHEVISKSIAKSEKNVDQLSIELKEDIENNSINNKLLEMDKYISELQKLYSNAFEKNNAFASLERTLLDEKAKLIIANQTISQKNMDLKKLQEDYMDLKKQLCEQSSELEKQSFKIIDLSTRLEKAFSVDSITQNQELISLKNNISNSLKLQYADFVDMSLEEMSEDNYQVFKITLKQVFKTLERYGIEFNN